MVETNKQMQEVLDAFCAMNPLPVEDLSPEQARQLPELKDAVLGALHGHGARLLLGGVIEPVHSVQHILIPGPASEMMARVYRPSAEENLPILLYFHGGGFVLCNLNSYDSSCRALANSVGCIVVALAYRQAPEHPFPAAPEDSFAAYHWLMLNGGDLGGDPKRIAVAGESAGGNLAAVVCQMAKRKAFAQPLHQLLVYPMTDNRMNTDSYQEHATAKPLSRAMMQWFWTHYCGENTDPGDEACPLQAEDLAGLAPATVITAEIDPLRDEGEQYAEKLSSFDVPVAHRRFGGVTHEFFGMGAIVKEGKEAMAFAASELKKSLFFDAMPLQTAV